MFAFWNGVDVEKKFCRDCGEDRPVGEFTANSRRADGLSFYCAVHLNKRQRDSRDRRLGTTPKRRPDDLAVPEGSRWCRDCGVVKPLDHFVRNASTATGFMPYCKPCHNSRSRASRDISGGARTYHLKRRYGISAADADAMLAAQGELCAICGTAPAAHVDHDHETGAVRQLLCFNCNGGLGQFRDDPVVLRAAAEYVERHRESPIDPARRAPRAGAGDRSQVQARVAWLVAEAAGRR